jgi:Cu/Zn superoxide dismutase
MSRTQRNVLLGLAAVVALVAIVIAVSGGGKSKEKTVTAASVTVRNAKPVGGVQTVKFKKGGTINLTVHSDVADEVHFHGYDVGKDVKAGGTVHFVMPAKIDGVFEVELESRKIQIVSVEVVP